MSEEITFDPIGTVTVTFDDQTYKLRRPKFGQWRYFQRKVTEMSDDTQATLSELEAAINDETDTKKRRKLERDLREFARQPFYELTIEWMREVFEQLGDPLPAVEDWPAWLAADVSLPIQITNHWKLAPKASGSQSES